MNTENKEPLTLWCYFLDNSEQFLDSFKVSPSITVADLRKTIHREFAITPPPASLTLWKLNEHINLITCADPAERIESLGDLESFAEKLSLASRVSTVWPEQPSEEILHVLVVLPTETPRAKRERSPQLKEDNFERLKRTKLATTAPSHTGKSVVYESIQGNPSEKILDDRSKTDKDATPVPLLYDGFGHFLDVTDGHTNVPGLRDINVRELEDAVDDFAESMAQFYSKENDRREVGIDALNRIFAARRGTKIPSFHASEIGSVRSDGHNVGTHKGRAGVVEFKNGCTGISAIPEIELLGHVAHLNKKMEPYRALFDRWRMPCLGITIVGADIRFYAIVTCGSRFRLGTLTTAISCISSGSDGRERKTLHTAFKAASVTLACIIDDIERVTTKLPAEIPPTALLFPSTSKLARYGVSGGEFVSFQILEPYQDHQSYRQLYVARRLDDDQHILVKFSRTYCLELHAFCLERGLAPDILAFQELPGGWKAIAMEYIEEASIITEAPGLYTYREKWRRQLRDLVDAFHGKNLVHGDLRNVNIICEGDDAKLIDFDWGGKDGEAKYPTFNLTKELLDGRKPDDAVITKADDDRILEATLKKLDL